MQVSLLKALSSGCHHQNAVMNTLKQKRLPKLPTYFIVEGRESAQVAEDGHSYHGGMQQPNAGSTSKSRHYYMHVPTEMHNNQAAIWLLRPPST